jgi:hypothetical protein
MAQTKTLTAPLAIIEINGKAVGKIRNLRIQEQVQRGSVRGLGELLDVEKPIVGMQCTFNCSYALIELKKMGTIDHPFLIRGVASAQQFVDTILLQDSGVNIHVYRKVKKTVNDNNVVTSTDRDKVGVIYNAFMNSNSVDISDGQIAMSDLSGDYLTPILFQE